VQTTRIIPFKGAIMRHMIILAFSLLLPNLTQADGAIAVAMPNISGFDQTQSEELLTGIVTAIVVGMNCPGFEITDGEWSLLNGAADLIANNNLSLDTDAYDAGYFGPAFALLDKPDTCATEGPKVLPMVKYLIDLGGSTEPM
jgi:hypothetical protein